jgi:hypothetical protein
MLVGCATPQSARVLAPGRTEVTVGVQHGAQDGPDGDASLYGQVMVRRGVGDNADLGIVYARTVGHDLPVSTLAFEPKFELTTPGRRTAVSLSLAGALAWNSAGDDGGLDLSGYAVVPSVLVGVELTSRVELVATPRIVLVIDDDRETSELELAGSLGVRLTGPRDAWAVQPELTYVILRNDDHNAFSAGLAISAGR